MCGCLVVLFGAVFPRFTIVMLELFTDLNDQAFDSFWIGFAGFLFLPYTTLAYVLMDYWGDPINGFGWVIVVFAFLVDLGSYFGTARRSNAYA
jgi:hypothetical protein